MSSQNYESEWFNTLFVEHPYLYLPELESLKPSAPGEVDGLCRIFDKYGVLKGSKILDLSCGIGRHSLLLAKRGFRVVGYDPSGFFIEKAKELADLELPIGKMARFVKGDLSAIELNLSKEGEGEFDVIISMCNSLGYSNEESDVRLLSNVSKIAGRNALLITEMENRDWRIRNFYPHVNADYGHIKIYEDWDFDIGNSISRSRSRFYETLSDGVTLKLALELETQLRLYSLHEVKRLYAKSGWDYRKSYGNFDVLGEVTFDSPNIIGIGFKKEED